LSAICTVLENQEVLKEEHLPLAIRIKKFVQKMSVQNVSDSAKLGKLFKIKKKN
jgi:hypothetical protein